MTAQYEIRVKTSYGPRGMQRVRGGRAKYADTPKTRRKRLIQRVSHKDSMAAVSRWKPSRGPSRGLNRV